MLKIIYDFIKEFSDHILSYLTVAISFVIALPLMHIGGGILLSCRLIIDGPPAYQKLKEMLKK